MWVRLELEQFIFESDPRFLTRFHGVFAPNSKHRVRVTPAKRGRGRKQRQPAGESWLNKAPAERHASMASFCSCKTGIYAIPGKNMDAAAQASIYQQ
jgi:hypothetical protein